MKASNLIWGVAILVAACAHDATAPIAPPRMILLDSLRAVNDSTLPCCSVTAGALSFYYPTHHSDYVETPDGQIAKACVRGVPNGVLINDRMGLTVSAEGDTLPSFVCTTGEFRLVVRSTLAGPDTLLSAGYYSWAPDSLWNSGSLVLIDTIGGLTRFPTVTSGKIRVPLQFRSYTFQVVRGAE